MRTKLLRRIRSRFDIKITNQGKYRSWIIYDKKRDKYYNSWSFNECITDISEIYGEYFYFRNLRIKNDNKRNQRRLRKEFLTQHKN